MRRVADTLPEIPNRTSTQIHDKIKPKTYMQNTQGQMDAHQSPGGPILSARKRHDTLSELDLKSVKHSVDHGHPSKSNTKRLSEVRSKNPLGAAEAEQRNNQKAGGLFPEIGGQPRRDNLMGSSANQLGDQSAYSSHTQKNRFGSLNQREGHAD